MKPNVMPQIPHVATKDIPSPEMDRNLRQSKPRLLLMGQRRYGAQNSYALVRIHAELAQEWEVVNNKCRLS